MAFVRTVKTKSSSGQVHEYVRIVEAYFEAGKRKQRVLANLGNLVSLRKDIKQIVAGLLRVAGERPLLFKEDLQNEAVQEYGLVYVAQKLWDYLELGEAITKSLRAQKVQLDYERWIKMMVTNKLSDPTSKLGIFEWLKGGVVAYLLEKLVEKALKRAQVPLSAEKALSSLKQMGVAVMKVDDKSYGYVSEPTFRQRQVLSALNISLPSRVLVPEK